MDCVLYLVGIMPRKLKLKYILLLVIAMITLDHFGTFTHLFELDYYQEFKYPLERNLFPLVDQLKNNEVPAKHPINVYNYTYLMNPIAKCKDANDFIDLRLVFLVRSPPENSRNRMAIRNSWGFESRFSDVPIRTVFIVGSPFNDDDLQTAIDSESQKFKDIIQGSFVDSFFNSTIKTVMALKWAKEFCPKSKFYMFTTDSVYVSAKNVLYFVRNPANYPDYIHDRYVAIQKLARQKRDTSLECNNATNGTNPHTNAVPCLNVTNDVSNRPKRQIEYDLADDVLLYAGYVYVSTPHRHKTSKWYVSLQEYPYHMWPHYVVRDAFILSKEALLTLYYGSFYTRHLKFDDIYLGIVAKKTGLMPFHCEEIYFQKKQYSNFNYKYVIASSGYDNVNEMLRLWSEQKEMGNA